MDIVKQTKLTYNQLVELNGPGYDPSDIRTYTCLPLASGPAMEIAIHLSVEKAHKTGKGTFAGIFNETPYGEHFTDFSTETNVKVNKMVLNFPKAAEFSNLKLLKSLELPSLYPSWMVERYNNDTRDKLSTQHQTPIFYDLSSNKFVVFLDTEFFRGTTPMGLQFPTSKHTQVYKSKEGKTYGAFVADSMADIIALMNDRLEEKPFQDYLQSYRQRFLDASKGERVICLALKTSSNMDKDDWFSIASSGASRSNRDLMKSLVLSQKSSFELYQGALIGDLIYLMDENGELYPDAIMCSTKHQRLKKEVIQIHNHDDYTFLMMPYNEADWVSLKGLHERMLALMNELNRFFLSGYNQEGLFDASVKQLAKPTGNAQLLIGHQD